MRASDASLPSGNASAARSSSVQVAPRSSERRSTGPQWLLTDPVNSRATGTACVDARGVDLLARETTAR